MYAFSRENGASSRDSEGRFGRYNVSKFFIDNMGIFFVPGTVMILNKPEVISGMW